MIISDEELLELRGLLDELAVLRLKIESGMDKWGKEDIENENKKRSFEEIASNVGNRLDIAYSENKEILAILKKLEKFDIYK